MTSFFRKLRWLMRRPAKEAELQEELQLHLEEEAAERQAQGLAADAALRAAQRDLGNLTLVKEDTRATWTWTFAEQFVQDIRYGLRAMSGNKTLTAQVLGLDRRTLYRRLERYGDPQLRVVGEEPG